MPRESKSLESGGYDADEVIDSPKFVGFWIHDTPIGLHSVVGLDQAAIRISGD